MKIFFTSDPHYFHKNVIGFCNRPFSSVEEMNEALIGNWNVTVKPEDKVYVMGDVVFGGTAKRNSIIPRLNGYKILIKGNHDDRSHKMLASGFQEVHYEILTTIPGIGIVRMSHYPYGPKGWFQKQKFKFKKWDMRYLERRPIQGTEKLLLHGHVHCTWKINQSMINVGVDVWNFTPVGVEQILELSSKG